MAKVVRLTTSQYREWRVNTPQLVRPDGTVARAVLPSEEKAIFPLFDRAQKTGSSFKTMLGDKPLHIEVIRTGKERGNFIIRVFFDAEEKDGRIVPLEKKDGRDVIRNYFVMQHKSDCQLRAPNGIIIGNARDPNAVRPSFKDSNRLAPKPENCECRDWGDPHPDKHHPACKWNSLAPHPERGIAGRNAAQMAGVPDSPKGITMQVPGMASTAPAILAKAAPSIAAGVAISSAPADVPDPESCQCSNWMRPNGKLEKPLTSHHPICEFAEAWKARNREEMSLVDLDSGEHIRPATDDEVTEAQIRQRKTGDSSVLIDGSLYGVLPTRTLQGKPKKAPPEKTPKEEAEKAAEVAEQ